MIIDAYAAFLAAHDIEFSRPDPTVLRLQLPQPILVSISPSGIVAVKNGENAFWFPFLSIEDMHEKIEKIKSR